jgi:HEAT repeat protein
MSKDEPIPAADALPLVASDDPPARLKGLVALRECEDAAYHDEAVAATHQAIDPADIPLAWFALQAYSRWAGEEAVPVVVSYLDRDNPYLVVAAAIGLADIGNADALDALVGLLQLSGRELTGRLALLRAAATNAEQVAELVKPLLEDDSRRVRFEAAVVISRLGLPDDLAIIERTIDGDPAMAPLREFYKAAHQAAAERARKAANRRRS